MLFEDKKAMAKEQLKKFTIMGIKPNYSAIARRCGLDRHTVAKMYKNPNAPVVKRNKPSKLDPFKEEIASILSDEAVTVSSCYFYLKDEGRGENKINCTLSNLEKYVLKHDLRNSNREFDAHVMFETDPGVQLQVDWKESMKLLTISGEILNFNLFSATLGYSRYHYFEYTLTKTEVDFKRCLIHAFQFFGGVTKEVLTDNMSAIVSIVNGKKTIHPTITQFFKDLGVDLRLCKINTPQTKGKVESSNRFASWLMAYDGKIADVTELIAIIKRLNIAINKQVNQTTKMPPYLLFAKKEKSALTEINKQIVDDWNNNYVLTQVVPSSLLVYYKKSYFSVPKKYINKKVEIKKEGKKLNIYYKNLLIASHNLCNVKKYNYIDEHYSEGLEGKRFDSEDKIEKQAKENLGRLY